MSKNQTEAKQLSRREMMIKTAGGLSATAVLGSSDRIFDPFSFTQQQKLKGRLKQSVCRWCYNKIPLDEFAKAASEMGIKGIDLIGPTDWPTVKKYGLVPTMTTGAGTIPDACNRKDLHDKLEKEF